MLFTVLYTVNLAFPNRQCCKKTGCKTTGVPVTQFCKQVHTESRTVATVQYILYRLG